MPRALTSGMLAAIAASTVRPALFVSIEFLTTTINLWSGIGSISFASKTWTGTGTLGGVSTVEEGSGVEAKPVSLTLSGIDSSIVADTVQEFKFGGNVLIYLGLFDNANALISDPVLIWAGQTDQPTLDINGPTATITIACESRLIIMNVAADRRLCQADQAIDYPGDLGFTFVAGCQEKQISWGRFLNLQQNPIFSS